MKLCVFLSLFTLTYGNNDYEPCRKYFSDLEYEIVNPVLLKLVVDCFNDAGPCSNAAACFKSYLPMDLATSCTGCSLDHKVRSKLFFTNVLQLYPDDAAILRLKYDPQNMYLDSYIAVVNQY